MATMRLARVVGRAVIAAVALILALAASPAFAQPSPASAQECDQVRKGFDPERDDPPRRINILLVRECLGDRNDQDTLAKKIHDEVLVEPKPDAAAEKESQRAAQDERVERVLRAFSLLDSALQDEFQSASESFRRHITALDTAIRASREMVKATGHCAPKESLKPELSPDSFKVDSSTLIIPTPPTVDLMSVLGPQCGDNTKADKCAAEIAMAETLARTSTLAESALTYYTSCYIDEADKEAIVLDRKWTTYFEDARSQYPWELAFNGWRMDKNDTRDVVNGNRMGFLYPPAYQWILAHPSVALEYVSDAPDGQEFKPAVLVEVFGYNRWKYEADGSMGNALGVSAVALFADRGEVKDLGYGLMMHVNNTYSIGVTRHDSDTGFVVSGDVSDLWLKVSQKWRSRLPAR